MPGPLLPVKAETLLLLAFPLSPSVRIQVSPMSRGRRGRVRSSDTVKNEEDSRAVFSHSKREAAYNEEERV